MIAQFQNSRRTMSPLWEDISVGTLSKSASSISMSAAEGVYLDMRAWQAIDAEVIILQKSYNLLVDGFVREAVPARR